MNSKLKKELINHIIETLNNIDSFDELHFHSFNEDYYIIGYFKANEWLKNHDLDVFEVIDEVKEYEMDNFGEFNTKINTESIVNMYVYIKGEELINNLDLDQPKKLLIKQLRGMKND